MRFRDRTEAGLLLAQALTKYTNEDVVIYALPRGGVILAVEIARVLNAPLDLLIVRKVGHPHNEEYAIAATAESGRVLGNEAEISTLSKEWFETAVAKQRQEARRRRERYLHGRQPLPVEGRTAIVVDDGIATGLTMRMSIIELRERHPTRIVVAVPVAPRSTILQLKSVGVDHVVVLDGPADHLYKSAVGAYYDKFMQVEDSEVTAIMNDYDRSFAEHSTSITI